MERLCLLVTVKFLFRTFRWWEIRSFFQPISWWKDDIYLVFFTFPWYSRTWEIRFFVQSSSGNLLTEVSLNTGMFHEKYDIKTTSPFLCFFWNPSWLDIVKIISPYNSGCKLLDDWVRQYFEFFAKRWGSHQRDTN